MIFGGYGHLPRHFMYNLENKRVGRKKAKKKVKHMKTIIFVGNHKNFSGLRLGTRLAHVLAEKGQDTVLAGLTGKLPSHTKLATLVFSAAKWYNRTCMTARPFRGAALQNKGRM